MGKPKLGRPVKYAEPRLYISIRLEKSKHAAFKEACGKKSIQSVLENAIDKKIRSSKK